MSPVLVELRRWDGALAAVAPALAVPETAGAAQLLRARSLLALGRHVPACEAAGAAIAHQPDDSDCHYILGLCLLRQNQPAKALLCARRAAELDPLSLYADHLKVLAHLRQWQRRQARAAGQHALQLDPLSPLAHRVAGLAAAGSGRRYRDAALMHFRQGLALDPHDQDLVLGLGDALRRGRRHQEASQAYIAAAAADFSDPRARRHLARLGVPALAGTGVAVNAAVAGNSSQLIPVAEGHVLSWGVAGTALLLAGAAVTTGLKLRRTRQLSAPVRAGLWPDQVNAALVWIRCAGLLLLLLADPLLRRRRGGAGEGAGRWGSPFARGSWVGRLRHVQPNVHLTAAAAVPGDTGPGVRPDRPGRGGPCRR